jgi:putative glycosyltransferase (TIGR04372 family)
VTGLQQAALIEAARAHREAGRIAAAMDLLAAAVSVSPRNASALHQLGLTLITIGHPDGLNALEAATRLDPNNVERIADLGDARLGLSDVAGGIANLRSAIALAPTREDLMIRLVKGLGMDRLAEAEAWVGRARCHRRPYGEALTAYGLALRRAGRPADALHWFHRAALEDPEYAPGLFEFAVALRQGGAPIAEIMKPALIAVEQMRDQAPVVIPVVQYLRDIGDEEGAVRLATTLIATQMERAAADEFGEHGIRILHPDDMIERLEIVFQLDLHIKMKMLGWLPPFITILLAPKERVVNATILDYYRPYVTVVEDPKLIEAMEPLKSRVPFNPIYVRIPDGRVFSKARAIFAVEEEWQRQGRKPLLSLTHPHVERGRQELKRMGVPDGAWFVGVHVREPGYLKESADNPESSRNADIFAYLPAVEEIVRRGGWVIRLGDPSMKPLPPMAQVVDYAVSPFKSEETDVFLMASCRFMLGTTSGPVVVSEVFGVPVGAADYFPIGGLLHTPKDVIIPRPYREKATGRMLHFEEYLKMPLAFTYDSNYFAALGLEALPSEPEDILDLAIEMLERTEGKWPYDAEDEKLNARWHEIARPFTLGQVGCRVGRGFLRRHQHLFQSL